MIDPDLLAILSFDMIKSWVADPSGGFWGSVGIVFSLLFACGLGLPVPEDVPLILSGAFLLPAGSPLWRWVAVGAACWCGIIGGDICLYFLGRRLGMKVTKLPLIGKHVTVKRVERVQHLFEKYGILVVGVGRLLAGIRGAMVVTAGTIRFNFFKFLIADGIAAVFSGGLFVLIGHLIGPKLNEETFEHFKHWFIAGAAVLLVGLVIWIVWRARKKKTVGEAIEEKVEQSCADAPTRPVGDTRPADEAPRPVGRAGGRGD